MVNLRTLRSLFYVSATLVVAGLLFLILWMLDLGNWTFLASVISAIIGTIILFYVLAQLESKKIEAQNKRVAFLLSTWLCLMAAGALFFGLWKIGAGEWAFLVSGLLWALFMLGPSIFLILQPDLVVTLFSIHTTPVEWSALSSGHRAVVYLCTVICLIIGIAILAGLVYRILSG